MLGSQAESMNGAGEKLFSCSRLPLKQDRGIGMSHSLNFFFDALDAWIFTNNFREAIILLKGFSKEKVLAKKLLLLQRPLNKQAKVIDIDGFLDKIKSPFLHCQHGFFNCSVSRHDYDRNRVVQVFAISEDFKARTFWQP